MEAHDAGLEEVVLASFMLNPEAMDGHDALIPAEMFFLERHRKLWKAFERVHRRHGTLDLKLIELECDEEIAAHLAGLYLSPAVLDSPTFTSMYLPMYLDELRRMYARREKARAARKFESDIGNGADEATARIELESVLDALESLDPYETTDEEILQSIGPNGRMPTGYPDLDSRLGGGMTRPGLNVLAARPSVGKSALARGIIRHAAARGENVFWYSVDQSASQIYELEIARANHQTADWVRRQSEDRLLAMIRDVRESVWRNRVQLMDSPQPLPVLLSLAKASGARLVVVDYLQAVPTGDESEYESVTRVSKALKALALEMRVPVLALAQFNRGEARADEIPSMGNLRASGQIEQDADQIWALRRDTMRTGDGVGEVFVLKNKTGGTGKLSLTWKSQWASYESLSGRTDVPPSERWEERL